MEIANFYRLFVIFTFVYYVRGKVLAPGDIEGETRLPPGYNNKRPCPLCDSSVYSYCSEKLFHDSCCCSHPYDLPYQCKFADCSFLHANSCHEHRLITQCCCSNHYIH